MKANTQNIRNEIIRELNNAIKNGLTRGTIVSSNGDMTTFTIRYSCFTFITVKSAHGPIETNIVRDAASAVLTYWKYTR